jgi:hypothetical protein
MLQNPDITLITTLKIAEISFKTRQGGGLTEANSTSLYYLGNKGSKDSYAHPQNQFKEEKTRVIAFTIIRYNPNEILFWIANAKTYSKIQLEIFTKAKGNTPEMNIFKAEAKKMSGLLAATVLCSLITSPAWAQEEAPAAAEAAASPLKLEVYLDAYIRTDTDSTVKTTEGTGADAKDVLSRKTDSHLNSVNWRRNEFNLNTAQVTASLEQDWYRGRATIQFGTIAQQAWAPGVYSPIQEANLGFKALGNLGGDGNNLWIDGGIFLTHIGNEALLPRYNWLSNLALVTMFEPFYQSGLRASYNWGDVLSAQVHVLNGYGNIVDNNDSKSVGWQVAYNPMSNLGVSWSALVGDESNTGDPSFIRFYNNFNLNYMILDNLGIRGQVDVANQSNLGLYYGGQLTARYDFLEHFGVTVRGEMIQDPNGVVTSDKLQGFGATLGLEYRPTTQSYVRLEGRQLFMDPTNNKMFTDSAGNATSNRFEILANTGIWF